LRAVLPHKRPPTLSSEYRAQMAQRAIEENGDPISKHKIGNPVPFDV